MPITQIDYTLVPNAAGDQRTDDPAGEFLPALILPVPYNLTITGQTSSTLNFSWEAIDDPSVHAFQVELFSNNQWITIIPEFFWANVRNGTVTGLSSNTLYGLRIRSFRDENQGVENIIWSQWSVDVYGSTDSSIIIPPNPGGTNLLALPVFENFEHLQVGIAPQYVDESTLHGNGNMTISDTHAMAGTRSAHTWCADGDPSFNFWGFKIGERANKGRRVVEGGECWWRVGIWTTPEGDYFASGGQLKFFRCMRNVPTGSPSHEGETVSSGTEMGITPDLYPIGYIESDTHVGFPDWEDNFRLPPLNQGWHHYPEENLKRGQWTMMETYTKFSVDPLIGYHGVWIDGVWSHGLNRRTLDWPDEFCALWYFGTYWNDGPRPSDQGFQEIWVDQIALAGRGNTIDEGYVDDTPNMDYDPVSGLPFIGMATL